MKYIPADKLIAYLKKTMESYKSQMVDPTKYPIDHIDLMAFLAREYQTIIANIESFQQEQPDGLDEAAEEVYPKMSRLSEPHGVIPADNKTHYLGDANEENRVAFKAGAKWDRTKMMEFAVEGEICGEIRNQENEPYEIYAVSDSLPLNGKFKVGDKVKVIIIPEED